jgi:hypothetical protein
MSWGMMCLCALAVGILGALASCIMAVFIVSITLGGVCYWFDPALAKRITQTALMYVLRFVIKVLSESGADRDGFDSDDEFADARTLLADDDDNPDDPWDHI